MLARRAVLAAFVIAPAVTACGGGDDAAVFDSATTQPPTASATVAPDDLVISTDPPPSASSPTPTGPDSSASTTASTTAPSTAGPDAAANSDGPTFPASAELAVSFSFNPAQSGGRIENPYIAVWVEDLDGNLVKTISLWYEQSGKGQRWLSDLRQWAAVSDRAVDATTSGATQVAGDYTVVWDGTSLDGTPVAQGDYVLFIEAAREHGPYEITSTPMRIGNDGFSVALDDSGELTNASAELLV
jgi:hypothetical protein